MDTKRLRQVHPQLTSVSESLRSSQETIQQVIETIALATTAPPSPSSRSPHGSGTSSPSGSSTRTSLLEREIQDLRADNRRLLEILETLRSQYGMCQLEINNAVIARESLSKKYRWLVRYTASLLQKEIDKFPPDENDDQDTRDAVDEDLKSVSRSPSGASASLSSGTARPVAGDVARRPNRRGHSSNVGYSQAAPSGSGPALSHASSSTSQLSASSHLHVTEEDETPTWSIHSGTKCPASVRTTAGPFVKEDFSRLGIGKSELEDLFQGLILPKDVGIRLALGPSPRGLEDVKLVFLYDPFYLESGTRTYILDWVTPQAHGNIVDWLESSDHGDEGPVFHTFTLSKKKKQWWYFGGMKWSVAWLNIWPTLEDPENKSRASILKRLSERSHGTLEPEEIEKQISTGQLQELCIEIASADGDMSVMQEIGSRLGRSPKYVRANRAVRGEQ